MAGRRCRRSLRLAKPNPRCRSERITEALSPQNSRILPLRRIIEINFTQRVGHYSEAPSNRANVRRTHGFDQAHIRGAAWRVNSVPQFPKARASKHALLKPPFAALQIGWVALLGDSA